MNVYCFRFLTAYKIHLKQKTALLKALEALPACKYLLLAPALTLPTEGLALSCQEAL